MCILLICNETGYLLIVSYGKDICLSMFFCVVLSHKCIEANYLLRPDFIAEEVALQVGDYCRFKISY
jgi:hypothetical protein